MRYFALTLAALFFALGGAASVQECPQGLAGMPNCVPPDHPGRQSGLHAAPAPAAAWEDRWGAIAMGKSGAGFSAIEGAESKRSASRGALAACRQKGASECKLIVEYSNQCTALAWGRTYWVTWRALTASEAEKKATNASSKEDDDCRVMYSACSMPQRVR